MSMKDEHSNSVRRALVHGSQDPWAAGDMRCIPEKGTVFGRPELDNFQEKVMGDHKRMGTGCIGQVSAIPYTPCGSVE